MAMYVAVLIYGLSRLGLWDATQLKGSIIWFFSVAVFSLFRVEDFSESPGKLKSLVADSFKLVVVIEYLVGAYTFHFLFEFALVPAIAFISGAIAYAGGKSEHEVAYKFLNVIAAIIGTAILGGTLYLLVVDFQQIANRQAVMDFVVPLILSTLYTPFVAFMAVYTTYQRVLIRLRYSIKKRHIEIYARVVAMLIFNVRIELLKRWSTNVAKCRLNTIREVNGSIGQFFRMLAREQSPEQIPLAEGWSPYQSKDFLCSEGIETGHYHPIDPISPNEWFCCSTLIELGQGLLPNNIAYYLNGDESAVQSLKLKLNVNEPQFAEVAHAKLLSSADTLVNKALGIDLHEELSRAITSGKDASLDGPDFKISITRFNWPKHSAGGYDLGFEVSGI